MTPGIFFSKAVDRRSKSPEALVPTIVTLPSKYSKGKSPCKTFQAGMILKFFVSVGYTHRLPSGLVGITKSAIFMWFMPVASPNAFSLEALDDLI